MLSWWSCKSLVTHSCSLLNHLNSFCGGMLKLNAKFDDSNPSLYLLSHFECNGHTVHMLTQQNLPPPLTSTVKSSLFTHAHSSPLSLVARSHQCCANHSHYINNGWTVLQTYLVYGAVITKPRPPPKKKAELDLKICLGPSLLESNSKSFSLIFSLPFCTLVFLIDSVCPSDIPPVTAILGHIVIHHYVSALLRSIHTSYLRALSFVLKK